MSSLSTIARLPVSASSTSTSSPRSPLILAATNPYVVDKKTKTKRKMLKICKQKNERNSFHDGGNAQQVFWYKFDIKRCWRRRELREPHEWILNGGTPQTNMNRSTLLLEWHLQFQFSSINAQPQRMCIRFSASQLSPSMNSAQTPQYIINLWRSAKKCSIVWLLNLFYFLQVNERIKTLFGHSLGFVLPTIQRRRLHEFEECLEWCHIKPAKQATLIRIHIKRKLSQSSLSASSKLQLGSGLYAFFRRSN
jgi:hypothetical protein